MILIIVLIAIVIFMIIFMLTCDLNKIKNKLNTNVYTLINDNVEIPNINLLNMVTNESYENYPGTYWRHPPRDEKLFKNSFGIYDTS